MDAMEARLMDKLVSLTAKLSAVETMTAKFQDLDPKLADQSTQLVQVQTQMDLAMKTIGKVQSEQLDLARSLKRTADAPTAPPPVVGDGLRPRPTAPLHPLPVPISPDHNSLVSNHFTPRVTVQSPESRDGSPRRPWLPKMDFPRFDGLDVRIWVDKADTFFHLYNIPAEFQVPSAHWYQSYKLSNTWHGWPEFRAAVLLEFEGITERDKLRELMTLLQLDSVAEYKKHFEMLCIRLSSMIHMWVV